MAVDVNWWISVIQLDTKAVSFFCWIQYRTIWLSDQRYIGVSCSDRDVIINALTLVPTTVAISSRFGRVNSFNGTTLVLAMIKAV